MAAVEIQYKLILQVVTTALQNNRGLYAQRFIIGDVHWDVQLIFSEESILWRSAYKRSIQAYVLDANEKLWSSNGINWIKCCWQWEEEEEEEEKAKTGNANVS